MLKYDNGESVESEDWLRMMNLIKQKMQENANVKPVEIKQGTITIKLNGLAVNQNAKAASPEHANYIEVLYKNFKIRVWKINKDKVFGCNIIKDEFVKYWEGSCDEYSDENKIIKVSKEFIDRMIG